MQRYFLEVNRSVFTEEEPIAVTQPGPAHVGRVSQSQCGLEALIISVVITDLHSYQGL